MNGFELFAHPWWVNLFLAIPVIAYCAWRKGGLVISQRTLLVSALFGIAFGFVEAAAVIYLRAAVGLLPGYGGALSDVSRLSAGVYQQAQALAGLPRSLLTLEFVRESATMAMLLSVALLSARSWRERSAMFIWSFAVWDIFYYVSLWATVRWPASLLTSDVLFLIPTPWVSQVWFPLLVSTLCMLAVVAARKNLKD